MIVKRKGNPGGPLTEDQFDGNFEELDTRLARVEGILDQRISAVVGLDRVEPAENREAVNFVLTDGRVNGPFGYVPRMNPVVPWSSGRQLEVLDVFEHLGTAFMAAETHISGDFDADRSANKLIQLLEYTQNGFAIIGEFDPSQPTPAGKGRWYIPDPTTPTEIEIWVAPMDIEPGVVPPDYPWVMSGTNAVANLREIQTQIGVVESMVQDVVAYSNDAMTTAAAAVSAVQAQAGAIAALQAKVDDLGFSDVSDPTKGTLSAWSDETDQKLAELQLAVDGLLEAGGEDPEEPTDPVTIAAADVTTSSAGVSVQAKLDDHEARITALQATSGGSTGPVAADEFTVGGTTLISRLTYLDDQNSLRATDIVEAEGRLDDVEHDVADLKAVAGQDIQASRIASPQLPAGQNLDQWLYGAVGDLEGLTSNDGPGAKLAALQGLIDYGVQGSEYADIGALLRGVLNELADLRTQIVNMNNGT